MIFDVQTVVGMVVMVGFVLLMLKGLFMPEKAPPVETPAEPEPPKKTVQAKKVRKRCRNA